MDTTMIEFLTTQGVFASLFGFLLMYVLKQNQIREENYQEIIQKQNELLPQIQRNVEEINQKLF